MARYINPVPGLPYPPGGKLFFYKSGTNELLTGLFADELETIAQENPVTLGADGSTPNVFYSGSARVVLQDAPVTCGGTGEQIWERDPVGGERNLANFELWDAVVIYGQNDIVEASNGKFYISLVNGNQGNDPTLLPNNNPNWTEIRFVDVWNAQESFAVGNVAQTNDGLLWTSITSPNLGNNPATDNGTNWMPAVDALKIQTLTKVVPQVGGGELTALRVNEIRDGSAYTFPLASSVQADQTITVALPNTYRSSEPTITASGSDTLSFSGGTDTALTYDGDNYGTITLTSDGASNWSI